MRNIIFTKKSIIRIMMLAAICLLAVMLPCPVRADSPEPERPAVILTGSGIGVNERAYTTDELKMIAADDESTEKTADNTYLYSAINTWDTKSLYLCEGVLLTTVLRKAGVTDTAGTMIRVIAPDKYTTTFDPSKAEPNLNPTTAAVACTTASLDTDRYYFPYFAREENPGEDGMKVPVIISWARAGDKGVLDIPAREEISLFGKDKIMLVTGQLTPADVNNPSWNGDTTQFVIVVGEMQTETALTFTDADSGKSTLYTRADLLKKPRLTYTFAEQKVRGVSLGELLSSYGDQTLVEFTDHEGVRYEQVFTKEELENGGYILLYEQTDDSGVYNGLYSEDGRPLLALYSDSARQVIVSDVSCINVCADIEELREAQSRKLDTYVNIEDYKAAQQEEIRSIIAQAKEQIANEQNILKIREIASDAMRKLAAVKTADQMDATDISRASVSLAKTTYVYTGKNCKPAVTVKLDRLTLKSGQDYTVTYTACKAIGMAKVTIKGSGAYWGSIARTYTIKPGKVTVKKVVPAKQKLTVNYTSLGGGVSYQVRLRRGSGSWKTYGNAKKLSRVFNKLKSGKKYSVRVRAYKKVDGKTYCGNWSAIITVKVK